MANANRTARPGLLLPRPFSTLDRGEIQARIQEIKRELRLT
jgi:hypothetical protein